MNFGWAIEILKRGGRVARSGWNGKGMWVVLLEPGAEVISNVMHAGRAIDPDDGYPVLRCIGMKTAQGEMLPGWLASQSDMLAEDWDHATLEGVGDIEADLEVRLAGTTGEWGQVEWSVRLAGVKRAWGTGLPVGESLTRIRNVISMWENGELEREATNRVDHTRGLANE